MCCCPAVETVCQGHGKQQGDSQRWKWCRNGLGAPALHLTAGAGGVSSLSSAGRKGWYWRDLGHEKHGFGEPSRAEVRSSPSTIVSNWGASSITLQFAMHEPLETLEKASQEKHPFLPQELSHIPSISLQ